MATAVVKWDKKGNPITGGGGRKVMRIPNLRVVVRRSAVPLVVGGVAGAAATGIALAIVASVPPLRRWAAVGGIKRAVVVTGTSLVVAGVGLVIAGKLMTPRRAVEAAPFVLGGALLTALAPVIASEIVAKIDSLLQGVFNSTTSTTPTTTTPSGRRNDGGALGNRRALTAAEVRQAETVRQQMALSPGGGSNRVPETIDMMEADRW